MYCLFIIVISLFTKEKGILEQQKKYSSSYKEILTPSQNEHPFQHVFSHVVILIQASWALACIVPPGACINTPTLSSGAQMSQPLSASNQNTPQQQQHGSTNLKTCTQNPRPKCILQLTAVQEFE